MAVAMPSRSGTSPTRIATTGALGVQSEDGVGVPVENDEADTDKRRQGARLD